MVPEPLPLDSGAVLPGARIAYETWGTLSPDGSNAVLVLHALTGDSHVAGPAEPGHPTPGWWNGVFGPGLWCDTDRYFVVAPNAIGGCQGSTGPSSTLDGARQWGSRFPRVTIRDQVRAELGLADQLGIRRWAAVVGGSMGGMRALEWAAMAPDRVERLFLLATCAAASADQIAWSRMQIQAIESDPGWQGGDYHGTGTAPRSGLGLARRIAQATYRSATEFDRRFGRQLQPEDPTGRYAIESYLDYHAEKLVNRFDAGSFVALSRAMNDHDVGRGRGGVTDGLRQVTARTVVAGCSTDRLYPLVQQEELAALIPGSGPVRLIESLYGHDAFLIETEQVGRLFRELLGASR